MWNRTAANAVPLAELGAVATTTIQEAVAANPLIITVLTSFEATRETLEPAALAGKTVITLNTGTPAGARETAAWADKHGAEFLAGAVKNVPDAVGLPDTLLYYSGDKAVFDRHEQTLKVLGGDTVHLGEDPDLAALYELAVGGMLLPALLGFFQGAALVTSLGRDY